MFVIDLPNTSSGTKGLELLPVDVDGGLAECAGFLRDPRVIDLYGMFYYDCAEKAG
jgi:hypothetical protein